MRSSPVLGRCESGQVMPFATSAIVPCAFMDVLGHKKGNQPVPQFLGRSWSILIDPKGGPTESPGFVGEARLVRHGQPPSAPLPLRLKQPQERQVSQDLAGVTLAEPGLTCNV